MDAMDAMDAASILAALGDAALKATAILALALLAARVLAGRPAALRYAVVASALAAAVTLPLLALVLPSVELPILPAPGAGGAPAAPESAPEPSPGGSMDEPIAWTPASASPAVADADQAAPLAAVPADRHAQPAVPAAPSTGSALGWLWWLLLAGWLLGAALLSVRLLVCRRRLRALLRDSSPVGGAGWLRALRGASSRLGIRRQVSLSWSHSVDVPITAGVVRPLLVLPAAARDWSPARCRAVLDHELAHVRRLDALTQWIAELAAILYWFHPLAWKAIGLMRALRERACDDHVLNCGALPSDYARDLLEIACDCAPGHWAAALAMARPSQLEARVVAVLDPDVDRRSPSHRAVTLVALAAMAAILPLASLEIGFAASRPAATAAATAEPPEPPEPESFSASSPRAPDARRAATRAGTHQHHAPWSHACASGARTRQRISIEQDETWSMAASWSNDRCEVQVNIWGAVTFAPDMSGVAINSPLGGSFQLLERAGATVRKVTVVVSPGGPLHHEYAVDGQIRAMDRAARRWYADQLWDLERYSGFAADLRVPQLLAQGGPAAVLAEVARLDTDAARGRYLRKMLEAGRLDDATVERTLRAAGQRIASDHELAEVLLMAAARAPLASAGARDAFVRAAATLQSDKEKARMLRAAASSGPLPADRRDLYFDAARGIRSDDQRARALAALVASAELDRGMVVRLLAAASAIGSDRHKRRLLVAVATKVVLAGDALQSYRQVAGQIGSDDERDRALDAIAAD